jgi:hypothetical protein
VRCAYERGEHSRCGELAVMAALEEPSDAAVRYDGRPWKLVISVGDRGSEADCASTYTLELAPA